MFEADRNKGEEGIYSFTINEDITALDYKDRTELWRKDSKQPQQKTSPAERIHTRRRTLSSDPNNFLTTAVYLFRLC